MNDALERIRAAQLYALRAHGAQMHGDRPYICHLTDVATILVEDCYGVEPELAQAAFLHDVIEDTDATPGEIEDLFGERVADLVWAVTGVGETRKERNESVYAKIHGVKDAAMLKVCDRLANIRSCLANQSLKHMRLYAEEAEAFKDRVVEPALPLPARLMTNFYEAHRTLCENLRS